MADAAEAVAFFNLFERAMSVNLQGRFLRAAEYFGRAASAARALWGDKGELCFVHMSLWKRSTLLSHTQSMTAVDGAAPLLLEAQHLLGECRRSLNVCLSANTCLCFEVEEDYFYRYNVVVVKAGGLALAAELKAACSNLKRDVGYEACMEAAY